MNDAMDSSDQNARAGAFPCPVCGKERTATDMNTECARCGADLADVIRARNAARRSVSQGRQALPHAPDRARAHLQRAYRLRPDRHVAQRIACAFLLQGRYAAAMHWRRIAQIRGQSA